MTWNSTDSAWEPAAGGGGSGTVTSVDVSVPSFLTISGNPISTAGTLVFDYSGVALPQANGGTGVTSLSSTPTATKIAMWDASKQLNADNFIFSNSGIGTMQTKDVVGATLGMNILTGSNSAASGATGSGTLTLATGTASGGATGKTGAVSISSGSAGSNATGDISLFMGTTSGSRGQLQIRDGTEGTASQCWISTDTLGHGSWAACPAGGNTYSANNHGVVLSGTSTVMTVIAPDASTTKVLTSGGSSASPTWSAIPAQGTATPTASTTSQWDASVNMSANQFIPGYATQATAASTLTLTVTSAQTQKFTGTTAAQVVKLPVTSTLALNQFYTISNQSSQTISVQSSGANVILVQPAASTVTYSVILTSGTTAASWFTNANGLVTLQKFTTGSAATYTTPLGVKSIKVTCVGGGAGGGNAASTSGTPNSESSGGGGGGGGTTINWINNPAATYTYTVGTAGAATSNGVASTFSGVTASAGGGVAGGNAGTSAVTTIGGLGGAGGTSSGGDVNVSGNPGGVGLMTAVNTGISGIGGSSTMGGGGAAAYNPGEVGTAGGIYGGGGSGGESNQLGDGAAHNGGAGGAGVVIVEEYY